MTGRTHDLAAFTGLSIAFALLPSPRLSLATLITSLGANMIGGLAPDLDQTTAKFWKQIRGGSVIAKLISPILGGHRLISHSLLGFIIVYFGSYFLLQSIKDILIVDLQIVWYSFLIGYLTHLITDSFTKEGIPLLFPLPFEFGFPPFKFLRIKTGHLIEKSFVFPGLIILNGYIFTANYIKLLDLLRGLAG